MCDDEEMYLREQLAILQRSYLETAQPIINRLEQIISLRLRSPIIVSADLVDPLLLDRLTKG